MTDVIHVALEEPGLHALTKAMEEGRPDELTGTARVVDDSRVATRFGGPLQQRPHFCREEEVPKVDTRASRRKKRD